MNPVGKALWFVESHAPAPLTLDDVANAACVTRYHLARAFCLATGHSVMGYLRARRLSQAACALTNGAPDILAVALDSGYGSHEAFTRAFRERFGVTPEQARAAGNVDGLDLLEPIAPESSPRGDLKPERFEAGQPLLIAGLGGHHALADASDITRQWRNLYESFLCHPDRLSVRIDDSTYGVFCNFDEEGAFDYVSGVAVADFSKRPREWSRVRVPAQRYAVFAHRDHIATIADSWRCIWNQWLPDSAHAPADAPSFERIRNFDTNRGTGNVELWLALEA